MSDKNTHPMRAIDINKVVVNVGVGEGGEKLIQAEKMVDVLVGKKTIRTISKTTNKDLGVRMNMPIGCKVTLRKKVAKEFLKRAFWVRENKIANYSFDRFGNFSFGLPDYTDFEGMKYDPDIGIFGMDVCVSLKRPGYRIAKRKIQKTKVPMRHRITKEEAYRFLKEEFNVDIVILD